MRSNPPSANFPVRSFWLSATGSQGSTLSRGTNSLKGTLPPGIWTPSPTKPSVICARGAAGICEASRQPEVLAVLPCECHSGALIIYTNLVPRPEAADDLLGRANTDLNVIQFAKSGARIQFAAFNEETANRVKRHLVFLLTKLVKGFHDRAIQISRPQIGASISRFLYARRIAKPPVFIMRRPDLLERFHIGKVQAVAEVNHRAQHCGMFDFAAVPFAFLLGPASRPLRAVLPKIIAVAEPVPRILAGE